MKTILRIILFLAVIVGIFAGYLYWNTQPRPENPDKRGVVKIGVIVPATGEFARIGQAVQQAGKIFEEQTKKEKNKFEYMILVEDNQFKVDKSVMIAQKLIGIDKVDAIVTMEGGISAAVGPVAAQNGIVHIGTDLEKPGPTSFGMTLPRELLVKKMLDELVAHGAKTFSYTGQHAAFSAKFVQDLRAAAEKRQDIKMLGSHLVNPNDRDFNILIMKVLEENPDIIITQFYIPQLDIFTRQLRAKDATQQTTCAEAFLYPEDKELYEGKWFLSGGPVAGGEYVRLFKEKTGQEATDFSEWVYASLEVLKNAYEKSGKNTPVVLQSIARESVDTIAMGKVYFDANKISQLSPVVMEIKNGIKADNQARR
ncbi:MAG: ABC transporter substrate-binding protein [Lactobacillales bacterium]|jgi:ABC-type branched-subunit amino acid transport system substrate-binding protein|nr:ABC transporter substrate-binding protein [Lactobacillales bacterium]